MHSLAGPFRSYALASVGFMISSRNDKRESRFSGQIARATNGRVPKHGVSTKKERQVAVHFLCLIRYSPVSLASRMSNRRKLKLPMNRMASSMTRPVSWASRTRASSWKTRISRA